MADTCSCGHAPEEHDPRNGMCEAVGCLCACYEPEPDDDDENE
jgi:hypothetical protein